MASSLSLFSHSSFCPHALLFPSSLKSLRDHCDTIWRPWCYFQVPSLMHNSLRESVILQHVWSLNIFKIASKVALDLFSKSSAIHTLTNVRTTKQPKGAGSWQHTHVPAVTLFLELNKTNKSSSHEKRCLPLELNPDKVAQQSFVPEQMFFITAPPLKFKDSKSLNIQAPSENSSQPHFRASSDGASCHHMCTFTWTGRRTDQHPLLVNSETASGLKGLFHARIVQRFLGFVYFQAAVFCYISSSLSVAG